MSVRARRQAWWIALIGATVAAPALRRPLWSPARSFSGAAWPEGRRRRLRSLSLPHLWPRPYIDRGNAIPAPYALGTLGLGTNVHVGAPTQAEPQPALPRRPDVADSCWTWSVGTLRVAPSLVFHSAQIGLESR